MAAAAALIGGAGSALGAAGGAAGAAGGAAGAAGGAAGAAGGAAGAAQPTMGALLGEAIGQKGTAGGAAKQKQGMEEGQPDQGYIDMSQPMGMQAQQSMMNQMGAGQRIQSPSRAQGGIIGGGLLDPEQMQLLQQRQGMGNPRGLL